MKPHKYILLFIVLLLLKPSLVMAKPIMQETSNFRVKMTAMGKNWEDELNIILNRNSHLDHFNNIGHFKRGPSLSEYLEDVDYLLANFNNTGDASNLFNWIKRQNSNGVDVSISNTNLSEFYQTLGELRKEGSIGADFQINRPYNPNDPNSKKFDLHKPSTNEFTELKNKLLPNANAGGTLSQIDIDQIIASNGAFSKITSLDLFKWKAYAKRGNSIGNTKALWKKAFIDNAEKMFTDLGSDKMQQLFLINGIDEILDANHFKTLLNNNQAFKNNALKFIK